MGSLIKYAHYNNLNKLILCNTNLIYLSTSHSYTYCVWPRKMKFDLKFNQGYLNKLMKFNLGNLRLDSENGVERDSYDPKQMCTAGAEVQHAITTPAASKSITTWAAEQIALLP